MGIRIGVDLDGVVVDFTSGWVGRYNAEFGADVSVADVTTWNAPAHTTHFGSMSRFWAWARTCGDGRSLFHVLKPYEGALEGLDALVHGGHDLVIITTKPRFAHDDTLEWLLAHEIPAVEVHILDDKAAVECDLYVDDADHNLVAYRAAWPDATIVRWVQPWNDPLEGVTDATSWDEILDLADGLAQG